MEVPMDGRREDGELTDSDVEYTPLERPDDYRPYLNPVALTSMNIADESDSDSDRDREPDSDSDEEADRRRGSSPPPRPKRRRIRTRRTDPPLKPNKYDVWCRTVQEDTLADDLLVCDFTADKYLGIEAYNHRLGFVERDDADERARRFTNKRTHRDRRDARLRIERRVSCDSDNERGEARHIPDLTVDVDSSDADVASAIAINLAEEKQNLILRIVEYAGKRKAIELFEETKRIERDGGIIVKNGTRRRTPGGVFIFLLKRDRDITQETVNKIFIEDKLEEKRRNRENSNFRNKKVEELKQTLTGGVIPAICTGAEWVAVQGVTEDINHHVSNPPPSPATDGRDGSSDVDTNQYLSHSPRNRASDSSSFTLSRETVVVSRLPSDPRANLVTSYDDDYLDIGCDDMDFEKF